MAEVIDFFNKVKEREVAKEENLADDDIISAKVVAKELFFETMILLEDMGYDVNENSDMINDLEAISFLGAALVFRAHGNIHPGIKYLDEAYEDLTTLADIFRDEGDSNAETDSTL